MRDAALSGARLARAWRSHASRLLSLAPHTREAPRRPRSGGEWRSVLRRPRDSVHGRLSPSAVSRTRRQGAQSGAARSASDTEGETAESGRLARGPHAPPSARHVGSREGAYSDAEIGWPRCISEQSELGNVEVVDSCPRVRATCPRTLGTSSGPQRRYSRSGWEGSTPSLRIERAHPRIAPILGVVSRAPS